MKRVLITGATGFLGRHCGTLLAQDVHVELHALVRGEARDLPAPCQVHRADLWDDRQVQVVCERVRPTHLLHLAWVTEPGAYLQSPDNLRWLEASLGLVRHFAAAGGQRLVVAGSCIEYDWSHGICEEDRTPRRSDSLYASCKNALHDVLDRWCPMLGLRLAWGRLFFLHGPGEHPNRFVASVIRSLLAEKTFECKTPAVQRDYIYVADAARAIVALVGGDVEGTYNIGSGTPISIGDLAACIGELTGRTHLLLLARDSEPASQDVIVAASTKKIHECLSWRAETDLAAGLRESIAWWKRSTA